MKVGCSPGSSFKPGSRPRLGLTLIITIMVVSSPILIFLNPVLVSAKSNNIDTSSQHSAFSLKDTSTPLMSPANVSPLDSDFTTQAPLQIPRTLQSTDLVNSLAFYEVTFITSTTGAIDKIQMDFPTGTGIGAAGIIERVGIGGGTLLKSGSSITYDLTTPVSIPAGTFIRLEMFGIKNPINPSTTFTAMITTKDSGGTPIDGPSQTNVYTIKKIVSSDLADGSVTFTKPAESFMKRVTLQDNAAGNAAGWNPDGVTTFFTITEPEALGSIGSFASVTVDTPLDTNYFCDVVDQGSPGAAFQIRCFSPPVDGDNLDYVVINLPPHLI
jgi:hypothetical protein